MFAAVERSKATDVFNILICPGLALDFVIAADRREFGRIDDLDAAKRVGFSSPFWSVSWDFTLATSSKPVRAIP